MSITLDELPARGPSNHWRAVERAALTATVTLTGALFWLSPRPPMGDLPQHAGQVALLHDLLLGTSPWANLVRINWFTPYLLPYGLATLGSFFLPLLFVFKLILTLAFYAFILTGKALRRELGSDERLDWLLIPGCFGFAFQYGFYTFLIAAPLGLWFIVLARRLARAPSRPAALRLLLFGVLLFFSHGLIFLFAAGVGVGMLLLNPARLRDKRALLPYALLCLLAVSYYLAVRLRDPLFASGASRVDWEWPEPWGWHRLYAFPLYTMSSTPHDPLFFPAVLLMLAAPWLMGLRWNPDRAAQVPMAAILVAWLAVPGEALKTNFLYHRFALFLLPAYGFALRQRALGVTAHARTRARAAHFLLALCCCSYLATTAIRERRFAAESAPFEELLSAATPSQRALAVILDPESKANHHPWAYNSFPVWYQAERQGFVDFNFAYFLPGPVRFQPQLATPFASGLEMLEQHSLDPHLYRYLFVRHLLPLPKNLFDALPCAPALIRESGEWALYEQRGCR